MGCSGRKGGYEALIGPQMMRTPPLMIDTRPIVIMTTESKDCPIIGRKKSLSTKKPNRNAKRRVKGIAT
jgi:hypothetical protein